MDQLIPIRPPFSFAHALAFARRFAPLCASVHDDALIAAVAIGGRAWRFELRARGDDVIATVADDAPPALARKIADFIGADDDLAPFYAAAARDAVMSRVVYELYGLHHVRFLGLEDIAVYAVLMQHTPMTVAASRKRRFLARFGLAAGDVRAMPELADLARLDASDITDAIGHRAKAERIATVVRGVAALGESFLREAPYPHARDALLAIPGVGPFTAGAILLRGLGRTEAMPSLAMFADDARTLYGDRWDPDAIHARYGAQLGTWAFYMKIAAARGAGRSASSIRPRRRARASG